MASKKIDVAVYDGDRVVAGLAARPVRLMPSGYAGVVYNGVVYPLYRGDFIALEDQPVDKDECSRFLSVGMPIRYAEEQAPTGANQHHLGIEDWYLESNRFGHYLVFDGSEAAAQCLVDAVEKIGLGVRRWDESSRPADNGEFYDWFIRLGFDGSRQECLRRVASLFDGAEAVVADDFSWDDAEDEPTPDDSRTSLHAMAGLVMDVSGGLHDIEEVIHRLVVFEQAPDTQSGYFAWRFREVTTRPGAPFNGSAYGRLQAISSIVKADKELIARLTAQHGRFLETRPHLAQQAMRAEFDKIDLDDTWWSSDGALRRARAGLTFLRHAAVLAFGMEDRGEQMLPLVRQLTPPATALIRDAPRNVIAAISNLGRMITFVEELFSKDDAELAGLHESGRAELLALERGDFDFLAELPSASSQAPRPLLAGDLPFVVLPPGELLQSFLGELRATGSYLGGTVDFERVRVLEHLGDYFQGRRCTVYRGAFPSSGKDNGYVVLGIARARSQDEDAVAVSPWKGEHATFVVRHGCGSKLPWPTVLSRTKKEAKQLGARRLQFRVKLNRGMDVYEAMLQKVVALLECEPHEFDNGEVYFDHEDGCYRVREPDDFLGYSVTSDESTSPGASHDESSPNVLQRIWNWFGRS